MISKRASQLPADGLASIYDTLAYQRMRAEIMALEARLAEAEKLGSANWRGYAGPLSGALRENGQGICSPVAKSIRLRRRRRRRRRRMRKKSIFCATQSAKKPQNSTVLCGISPTIQLCFGAKRPIWLIAAWTLMRWRQPAAADPQLWIDNGHRRGRHILGPGDQQPAEPAAA
jgi:hypothetical protein